MSKFFLSLFPIFACFSSPFNAVMWRMRGYSYLRVVCPKLICSGESSSPPLDLNDVLLAVQRVSGVDNYPAGT